jgi:hypothetical protein
MLTRQPSGTVNLLTVLDTPAWRTTLRDKGRVAAEDAVPHAVIQAGEHRNQNT